MNVTNTLARNTCLACTGCCWFRVWRGMALAHGRARVDGYGQPHLMPSASKVMSEFGPQVIKVGFFTPPTPLAGGALLPLWPPFFLAYIGAERGAPP
jgi:hypothetical protein